MAEELFSTFDVAAAVVAEVDDKFVERLVF